MDIATLGIDSASGNPMIVLKEHSGERILVLPITPQEATGIAIKTFDVTSERPLTIDLVKIVLEQSKSVLERVVIHDFQDGYFCVRLEIRHGRSLSLTECRPSDAIALAMRCQVPVFMEESVLRKSGSEPEISEADRLRKTLRGMDTMDFGVYYVE